MKGDESHRSRPVSHKVTPSHFSHAWKPPVNQSICFATDHLPEFEQVFKTAQLKGTQQTRFVAGGTIVSTTCSVFLSYPGTVIPTELHSEKENEFEGLSMTLILPNTTVPQRIQYRQTNTNKINSIFAKEETKSTALLASACSRLTIDFQHATFLCCLFNWTPRCHLGSPLLCTFIGVPVLLGTLQVRRTEHWLPVCNGGVHEEAGRQRPGDHTGAAGFERQMGRREV